MSDEAFYAFLLAFYTAARKAVRGGGAVYVFHSTKESVNFIGAMKAAGFKVAQTLVWVKNHFTLGRQDYQWIHEPILYGWKVADGCGHYFADDRTNQTVFESKPLDIKRLKKEELQTLLEGLYGLQTDIVRCDKPTKSPDHPTMKPIPLVARLIYNSSREGDLVFDPFGGSGSTLIAAGQLNRECRTIELAPRYCDVIVKRFRAGFPAEPVALIRDGERVADGALTEMRIK
jgi:DNA modification methylase